MQFNSLSKLVVTSLALASAASGYVVEYYASSDCTGSGTERNVYDNTCTEVLTGFNSVKVGALSWGPRQHAHICTGTSIGCAGTCLSWWANGNSPQFQVGSCIDLGDEHYSLGSFAF